MTIELKCWPDSFDAIAAGIKTAEVRSVADRDFMLGDILKLRRWDPVVGQYTGQEALAQVRHITRTAGSLAIIGMPGPHSDHLAPDLVVMSIRLIETTDQHGTVSHV